MLRSLALLLLAIPASAGVRTVAPSGADHAQIAAAIAACAPGDVVLVRAGTYAPFAIDGQGVVIVADVGANVVVQGPVAVRNVPAGSVAELAGLRIAATNTTALTLSDCPGSVRLVDLMAWVAPNAISAALPGARIERCADVALSRCALTGPAGPVPDSSAGCALRATDSVLSIHDSTLVGGYGLPGTASGAAGGDGGHALEIRGGTSFVAGTFLTGGPGGAGGLQATGFGGCSAWAPRPGGDGGRGLDVDAAALVRVLDATITGGTGGAGATTNCGQHAADGAHGASSSGAWTAVPGSARALFGSTCAREGGSATFEFRGVPGERVVLFLSDGAAQSWNAGLFGTVLVRVPFWRRVQVGTLGASGVGTAQLAVPELGPGLSARVLHLQAVCLDASGTGHLGAARPLVLLDRLY